ncbi:hypothetical protein ACOCHS_06265 [Propionibacteriaceae bacterium Y2011]
MVRRARPVVCWCAGKLAALLELRRDHYIPLVADFRERFGLSVELIGEPGGCSIPEAAALAVALREDPSTRCGAAVQGWHRPASISDLVAQLADEAVTNLAMSFLADGEQQKPVHLPWPWESGDDKPVREVATEAERASAVAALNAVSVFS